MGSKFDELVSRITQIGLEHHAASLLENTRRNAPLIQRTLRDIQPDQRPCLVVSAGPSLSRGRLLHRLRMGKKPLVVATDGAYLQCLKSGIVPDWVVTIDPHPTRIVVLFGAESQDDYFERARPDHGFEQAAENARLVDEHPTRLVIASSAPEAVELRTRAQERFWFVPLVDDPDDPQSLTARMVALSGLPAMNTGGTVGTAAWLFAHAVLRSRNIAVVGMDFGYPDDVPLANTQEARLTGCDPEMYPSAGNGWYRSPTYEWYRRNFMDLLEAANARIVNCSEGGLLDGERVKRMRLEEWLAASS